MIKKLLFLTIVFVAVFSLAAIAVAQNPFVDDIEYPVGELGGCEDRAECKSFCDVPDNLDACLSFAKKAGLISEEEVERIERMENIIGPGECEGKKECKLYCEDIDNMDECIAFAEEHDLVDERELDEMRRISATLKTGLRPPCNSERECNEICHLPENAPACIAFAEAAGLMTEKEHKESKKYLEAIANGAIPPACNGPRECDIYCSQREHMLECSEFALAAGFTPPGEEEDMRRSIAVMRQGIMPPDCRGREECDAYCSEEEHVEECMKFSVAAGYMTQQQADHFKRSGGKGPGGCVGEAECYEFCGNPDNVEVCLDFGVMMGEMTQEEANRIRQEIKEGRGRSGPGGCTGSQECEEYCSNPDNMQECERFRVDDGRHREDADFMGDPNFRPGGCTTEQECKEYCNKPKNVEECSKGPRGPNDGPMDFDGQGDFDGRGFDGSREGDDREFPPFVGDDRGPIDMEKEDLIQKLKQEFGDEWEEKFNEKIESGFFDQMPTDGPMRPEDNRGQYPEERVEPWVDEPWRDAPPEGDDFKRDFDGTPRDFEVGDFRREFDGQSGEGFDGSGQFQDTRFMPREDDGLFGDIFPQPWTENEGEFKPKTDFSPEGINDIIFDVERNLRDDSFNEIGTLDEQWNDDNQWQSNDEWQVDQQPISDQWTQDNWNDTTSDIPEPSFREQVPAYDSDHQDSIYQELPPPTAPEPTFTEPTSYQPLLDPFKKFFGNVVSFLAN